MSLQFLSELFSPYGQDTGLLCEVRCLFQNRANLPIVRYFGLTHLCRAAAFAQEQKAAYDVYTGILPRMRKAPLGKGGLDKDVQDAAWLWCDLDRGDGTDDEMLQFLEYVKAKFPCPRMIVFSGSGGVHLYWRLPVPLSFVEHDDRDVVAALLRRVPLAIGVGPGGIHADKQCQNFSRILRLPHTLNHKHAPPMPVWGSILAAHDILTMQEWEEILPWPALPLHKTRPRLRAEGRGGVPAGLMRWAEAGYPEGNRHHDIVGAAAFLRRDTDLPENVAHDLLVLKAQNSGGRRQITDDEIEKAWDWAA